MATAIKIANVVTGGAGNSIGGAQRGGAPSPPPSPFTFKVDTRNPGATSNTQYKLPTNASGTYNFVVDWGDGSAVQTLTTFYPTPYVAPGDTSGIDIEFVTKTHTYPGGTYVVKVCAQDDDGGKTCDSTQTRQCSGSSGACSPHYFDSSECVCLGVELTVEKALVEGAGNTNNALRVKLATQPRDAVTVTIYYNGQLNNANPSSVTFAGCV